MPHFSSLFPAACYQDSTERSGLSSLQGLSPLLDFPADGDEPHFPSTSFTSPHEHELASAQSFPTDTMFSGSSNSAPYDAYYLPSNDTLAMQGPTPSNFPPFDDVYAFNHPPPSNSLVPNLFNQELDLDSIIFSEEVSDFLRDLNAGEPIPYDEDDARYAPGSLSLPDGTTVDQAPDGVPGLIPAESSDSLYDPSIEDDDDNDDNNDDNNDAAFLERYRQLKDTFPPATFFVVLPELEDALRDGIPRSSNPWIFYRAWYSAARKAASMTKDIIDYQKDSRIIWKIIKPDEEERAYWFLRAAEAEAEHKEKYQGYTYQPDQSYRTEGPKSKRQKTSPKSAPKPSTKAARNRSARTRQPSRKAASKASTKKTRKTKVVDQVPATFDLPPVPSTSTTNPPAGGLVPSLIPSGTPSSPDLRGLDLSGGAPSGEFSFRVPFPSESQMPGYAYNYTSGYASSSSLSGTPQSLGTTTPNLWGPPAQPDQFYGGAFSYGWTPQLDENLGVYGSWVPEMAPPQTYNNVPFMT